MAAVFQLLTIEHDTAVQRAFEQYQTGQLREEYMLAHYNLRIATRYAGRQPIRRRRLRFNYLNVIVGVRLQLAHSSTFRTHEVAVATHLAKALNRRALLANRTL